MSDISRELLWLAWPKGYVALRGVSTVGGWQTYRVWDKTSPEEINCGWMRPFGILDLCECKRQGFITRALASGNLLPNVDPADTATWACLKKDLALAAGAPDGATEIGWRWTNMGLEGAWVWCLSWQESGSARASQMVQFDINTTNSADALVLARIKLGEKSDV